MSRWSVLCSLVLAAVCLLPSCRATTPGREDWSDPIPLEGRERTVSADGVAIEYHVAGAGDPALVFVHGWSCDANYWSSQVRHFSPRHRVVAIDLAGHGGSGTERQEWTVPAFAADVVAVVESLDLPRVVLIGHSMSGDVILEAARMMPERVLGLIPVDTLQNVDAQLPEAGIEPFLAPFRADFAGHARTFIASLFTEGADPRGIDWVASDVAAADPAIAIPVLEGVIAFDEKEALAGIDVPIHAVNGDRFKTVLEANRRVAPQFEATILPGLGHYPMLVAPNGFNRALEEVLESFTAE